MDLAEAQRMAECLMAEHLRPGWSFRFEPLPVVRGRQLVGQCRHPGKVLAVDPAWAAANDEAAVRVVVLHEVAHALAGPGHKHGPWFRRVAQRIGATPRSSVPA